MAVELIKFYKEHFPALRFIGRRYTDSDRDKYGTYAQYWGEFFEKGLFGKLEGLEPLFPDYFGLMGYGENEFEYWIGMCFPAGTAVPEGFSYVDIPEGDAGIGWIRGKEAKGELYGEAPYNLCVEKLNENGLTPRDNFRSDKKWFWIFERYNCPRFTEPAEDGTVILDYGIYVF